MDNIKGVNMTELGVLGYFMVIAVTLILTALWGICEENRND